MGNYVKTFEEYSELNESNVYDDFIKKYADNPYGIGAQIVDTTNDKFITLRYGSSFDRQNGIEKLREFGFKNKDLNKGKQSNSFKYPYEIRIYKN